MRGTVGGLLCPMESIVGADVDDVHERSMEWASSIGLAPTDRVRTRLDQWRFGELASRAYPHATVDDRVLITGWLMYVAVLDDLYDARPASELPAVRAEFRAINAYLHGGRFPRMRFWRRDGRAGASPTAPLTMALGDLWGRTSEQMPGSWQARFGYSMATFLDGVGTEAKYRAASRLPSLDEYLQLRRATSACGLLFDFIQLGTHEPLADAVHFHPSVEALRTTACDVVAWINDLASMAKEQAAGADHNLVLVLRRTGGLSTPLARAVATDMVNDGIRRLWYDADALPDLGASLTDYVQGFKYWVRANIDWSAESGRYQPVSEGEGAEPDR
jgi:hypothetical protein